MARILVVDDEKNLRLTMSTFIKREGHEVFVAENAPQALEIISGREIDLVFSDIVMPRMSGVELLNEITARSPRTLVIMLTGEPTLTTATEALRLGAFDYLTKPVSKSAALQALDRALQVKALKDEKIRLEEENRHYQDHLEKLVEERTQALGEANQNLSKLVNRLHVTLNGIVQALAAASEWRDPYTAGHQRRVARLASAILKRLGGTAEDQDRIEVVGLLHDLGKIAVPGEILAKPGRLSPIEIELIRQHPQVGYEILCNIEFPWPVAEIVRQHHYRIDGSGYPGSIAPESLLFEAKILAVADTMEAMSSHRPYRPALAIEVALEEIREGAGRRYDPEVAAACLELYRDPEFRLE